MIELRLSAVQALRSATATAAEVFGWHDRGTIRGGAVADPLLVKGDPSTLITDMDALRAVWLAGRRADQRGRSAAKG